MALLNLLFFFLAFALSNVGSIPAGTSTNTVALAENATIARADAHPMPYNYICDKEWFHWCKATPRSYACDSQGNLVHAEKSIHCETGCYCEDANLDTLPIPSSKVIFERGPSPLPEAMPSDQQADNSDEEDTSDAASIRSWILYCGSPIRNVCKGRPYRYRCDMRQMVYTQYNRLCERECDCRFNPNMIIGCPPHAASCFNKDVEHATVPHTNETLEARSDEDLQELTVRDPLPLPQPAPAQEQEAGLDAADSADESTDASARDWKLICLHGITHTCEGRPYSYFCSGRQVRYSGRENAMCNQDCTCQRGSLIVLPCPPGSKVCARSEVLELPSTNETQEDVPEDLARRGPSPLPKASPSEAQEDDTDVTDASDESAEASAKNWQLYCYTGITNVCKGRPYGYFCDMRQVKYSGRENVVCSRDCTCQLNAFVVLGCPPGTKVCNRGGNEASELPSTIETVQDTTEDIAKRAPSPLAEAFASDEQEDSTATVETPEDSDTSDDTNVSDISDTLDATAVKYKMLCFHKILHTCQGRPYGYYCDGWNLKYSGQRNSICEDDCTCRAQPALPPIPCPPGAKNCFGRDGEMREPVTATLLSRSSATTTATSSFTA